MLIAQQEGESVGDWLEAATAFPCLVKSNACTRVIG